LVPRHSGGGTDRDLPDKRYLGDGNDWSPIDCNPKELKMMQSIGVLAVFDYVFYRIYKFFRDKGDDLPKTKGSTILTLMQSLLAFDLVYLITSFGKLDLPGKFYFVALGVVIGIANWLRYERSRLIIDLEARWKTEDSRIRKQRGWYISMCLTFAVLLPIYGNTRAN
jgi:hypothetical protein